MRARGSVLHEATRESGACTMSSVTFQMARLAGCRGELTGEGVSVGERTVGAAGECGEGGACGDSAGGGGEYFDCLPA